MFQGSQIIFYILSPGAYVEIDVESKLKSSTQENHKPNIIDHLMKVNRYQSIPSIPTKN